MLVRRPLINDSLYARHQRLLSKSPCVYPFTKTVKTVTQIDLGRESYESCDLFVGKSVIPSKLFCVIQAQDRSAGSYTKNFLKCEMPPNCVSGGFYLDSKLLNNFQDTNVSNFDQGLLNFLYLNMFQTTQTYYTTSPPDIDLATFRESLFIVAADTSPAQFNAQDTLPLMSSGVLKLHLNFSQPTTQVFNVFCFGIMPASLSVDKNKVVRLSNFY